MKRANRTMPMHDAVAAPVPPHYRGVWRRTLLASAEGSDTGTTVFWLQASRWHADIRLPAGRPDFSGIRGLADCGPAHIAWLARQQGFAGVTAVSRAANGSEICEWHRHADFQPPPATPDAGAMRFRGNALTETGVHARYLEKWRRLPDPDHGCAVLRRRPADGRPAGPLQLLLVAGAHVMHVRARAAPWPAGIAPGTALADLVSLANPELLDFEISFGQRNPDGWTIGRSTLPWLENRAIPMRIRQSGQARLEMDFGGDVQSWDVLEWTPPGPGRKQAAAPKPRS